MAICSLYTSTTDMVWGNYPDPQLNEHHLDIPRNIREHLKPTERATKETVFVLHVTKSISHGYRTPDSPTRH